MVFPSISMVRIFCPNRTRGKGWSVDRPAKMQEKRPPWKKIRLSTRRISRGAPGHSQSQHRWCWCSCRRRSRPGWAHKATRVRDCRIWPNLQQMHDTRRLPTHSEPEEEAGLADGGVADQEKLEQVIAANQIEGETSAHWSGGWKGWEEETKRGTLTIRCSWLQPPASDSRNQERGWGRGRCFREGEAGLSQTGKTRPVPVPADFKPA